MLPEDFSGTDRYVLQRRLGAGAAGVVYEALDRDRNTRVALKLLRRVDAAQIYRLKHEFRALSDVTHPGLAALHELASVGDNWFLTMELVNGVDFLRHVRAAEQSGPPEQRLPPTIGRPRPPVAPPDEESPPSAVAPSNEPPTEPHTRPLQLETVAPIDLPKLRAAARQLAEAVQALHAAGKLHRDLKPSNVLVTPEGRVVVLDFGLVAELAEDHDMTAEGTVIGTAAYMAPEQAAARPVSEATDWYAVGVMLFEALTGRLPFEGKAMQVLLDKQRVDPPSPRALFPDAPDDLSALCVDLLKRNPEERPRGDEVLARLGVAPAPPLDGREPSGPLVGRAVELAALADALQEAQQGSSSVVFVSGASGVGKTALARHFLEKVALPAGAVVLKGRCYERESLPFKAVDGLVDALTRHLLHLERSQCEVLLPRNVRTLARLFPVLWQVPAIEQAPGSLLRESADGADAVQLRWRAFEALRELLGRLGERRPLVLFIDDLQWGDDDSATLLTELLRPPNPPPLLLLGCFHHEQGEPVPPLRQKLAESRTNRLRVRDLPLRPLRADEAAALGSALLGEQALPERAAALARESGGNPFFLNELVRHGPPQDTPGRRPPSLVAAIQARARSLPAPARRLLEVVAAAERPVPEWAALLAAGLDAGERSAERMLRAAKLLQSAGSGDEQLVPYHERIREAVVGGLTAIEQSQIHLQLGLALESRHEAGEVEAEALAFHFGAAGELTRACRYAELAAHQAARVLAFDQAAALYRRAIALLPPFEDPARRQTLTLALGEVLSNAGRGREAAQAYLEVASQLREEHEAGRRHELARRAGEQLLRSGDIEDGLAVLQPLLGPAERRMTSTPRRAIGSLLWRRARLALRGLSFQERPESQIPPAALAQVDLSWSLTSGLAMVDPLRAASFQAQHLLLALAAGEPGRVARALATEAVFRATTGLRGAPAAARLLAQAEELAERRGADARLQGLLAFCAGFSDFLLGHWSAAHQACEEAEHRLHKAGGGVTWESANARLVSMWSLLFLGRLDGLSRRLPALIAEARGRGDLYAAASLRTGLATVVFLADDDVEGARREVAEVMSQWPSRTFHFQHYWAMLSNGMADLYASEGARAWTRLEAEWPALVRSRLLAIESLRIEAHYLRARCALAAAWETDEVASGPSPATDRWLEAALQSAARLEREQPVWARALATLVRASLARLVGDTEGALTLYERAEATLATSEMELMVAATRRRRADLLPADEGAGLRLESERWMTAQGIRCPERMASLWVL